MARKGTRKRKIAVTTANEEKENEMDTGTVLANEPAYNSGPVYKIMSHVQTSEALHKKYIKDLQQLYTKMDHKAFIVTFIQMIKAAMACDETNEYALTSLQFCAKFIASYDGEETHPVVSSIFEWILETISNTPHIRFRLCQFINMILNALGPEAALDDLICDKILEYMVDRLLDCSPNVRLQAITAMQRLQVPDNPDDPVVRAYQFHLCSDPSPRVRLAVIGCMGRNIITVPYILDRLYDIDEKVRRYTYIQMSSYPVRSYKVSQRLLLLERGLNDRSEVVRKAASRVMLTQWLESYKKDVIQLIAALKLDASEADIERFRKVATQMLCEIFNREEPEFLIKFLPFDAEYEFQRCIPFEKLTMEAALYWQCLSDFFQKKSLDEFDSVLPELSTFCAYTEKFCTLQKTDMDKFENLDFQFKLLFLLEILNKYDLGDETGRVNLKKLMEFLLKKVKLNEKNLEIVVKCAENAITDQNERVQFLIGIVSEICQLNPFKNNLWQDRTANEALANCTDSVLKMKLTGFKVKILEAEEQEMTLLQEKNFAQAQKFTDEKNLLIEDYLKLLKPLLSQPLDVQKLKNEDIITGLQILFHMIVSKKVRSLSSQITKLYKDFVCRQMASTTTSIRVWALKCGTAFSMHFETIAKEVFQILYSQFKKHSIERIWEISVKCIFEILDLYGVETFSQATNSAQPTTAGNVTLRRGGRLLYNTLENLDLDDDDAEACEEVNFILLMSHFIDSVSSEVLINEIVLGFIRLILHGHLNRSDIIEKLLLRYFNPSTNSKTNQYLSIFMEEMIRLRKQSMMMPALLPTINAVLTAPYDSPLLEIRPETITRFFIDITRRDPKTHGKAGHLDNLHNKIAHAFLTEMANNVNNRDLSKLLSKEMLKLELNVASNPSLKQEIKEMTNKLLACDFDGKTLKNFSDFRDMVDGRLAARALNEANETDEEADENTLQNENQARSNTEASENPSDSVTPSPCTIIEENESTLKEQLAEDAVSGDINISAPAATTQASNVVNITATAEESVATATDTDTENNSQSVLSTCGNQSERVNNDQRLVAPQTLESAATSMPTTFGLLNGIGQRYLRRSLNNSFTRSESESSDAAPKIRIELRIDSDKKNKAEAKKQASSVNSRKNQRTPTLSRALDSASSRSLRMLSRQQRNEEQTQASPKSTQGNEKSSATATSASKKGSLTDELNTSEVIVASPQQYPKTRRRLETETIDLSTAAVDARKSATATNVSPIQQRKSDNKTTKTTPKQGNRPSNPVEKAVSLKTPPEKQLTATTAFSRIKTPIPAQKTPSPRTRNLNQKEQSPQKINSPRRKSATNSAEKTEKAQQTSNIAIQKISTKGAATAGQQQRLPRKTLYATTTLQIVGRSTRKRTFTKTTHLRRSGEKSASPSKSNASSRSTSSVSSSRSPKRKQARRSIKKLNQQKRLTPKDIENLLEESASMSSSHSDISSDVSSLPAKKRHQAYVYKKAAEPKTNATATTSSTQGLATRNQTREKYFQQNIITRTRKSMQNSPKRSSSASTLKQASLRQRNAAKSRIPVKSCQVTSSATSEHTSRSSSRSPRRKVDGGFKQPAPQLKGRGRPATSRIPRRLL